MLIKVVGIRGLPSTYSGLETILGELAPRWVKAGHEVIVYCRKSLFAKQPPEWKGVKLIYLPSIEHKALSTIIHSFIAIVHASIKASNMILVWNAANGPFGLIMRLAGEQAVINVDGMVKAEVARHRKDLLQMGCKDGNACFSFRDHRCT